MEDYSTNDSKCPSCGGRLIFDPEKQLLCCDFCGNDYSPEKIELLFQKVPICPSKCPYHRDHLLYIWAFFQSLYLQLRSLHSEILDLGFAVCHCLCSGTDERSPFRQSTVTIASAGSVSSCR